MKARGLVAIALACAGVGTLVTNRPASAQIDPMRLSYGLYLVREGTTPVRSTATTPTRGATPSTG